MGQRAAHRGFGRRSHLTARLAAIRERVDAGKLKAHVATVLPLAEIKQAFELSEGTAHARQDRLADCVGSGPCSREPFHSLLRSAPNPRVPNIWRGKKNGRPMRMQRLERNLSSPGNGSARVHHHRQPDFDARSPARLAAQQNLPLQPFDQVLADRQTQTGAEQMRGRGQDPTTRRKPPRPKDPRPLSRPGQKDRPSRAPPNPAADPRLFRQRNL